MKAWCVLAVIVITTLAQESAGVCLVPRQTQCKGPGEDVLDLSVPKVMLHIWSIKVEHENLLIVSMWLCLYRLYT